MTRARADDRADAALYAAKKAGRNTWRVMADDVLIETVDAT